MAIDQLLQFSVFEPDQIACMRAAYEDALDALQPMIIIEAVQTGERDPDRLRERALRNLIIAMDHE
jgi:hypothetical protein